MQWVSWGDRDPHREYLLKIDEWFGEMETLLPDEIARRVESGGAETADRGAVWTYLTTDQPFQSLEARSVAPAALRDRGLLGMGMTVLQSV